jgi:hypothetical protein
MLQTKILEEYERQVEEGSVETVGIDGPDD